MLINSGVNMPSFAVVVDITDDVKEETPLILDEDFELRSSHKKPSVYWQLVAAGRTNPGGFVTLEKKKKRKRKIIYIYIYKKDTYC